MIPPGTPSSISNASPIREFVQPKADHTSPKVLRCIFSVFSVVFIAHLAHRFLKHHSIPVLNKKNNAPKNLIAERPAVAQSNARKKFAVRTSAVCWILLAWCD